MTVADNLRAGALGARGGRTETRAALARVHELFPVLADRAHQRAGLLSGGEQQMLAMGRALMAGPRLLLLDEPSLGLAPLMAARIAETVQEINAGGTSVMLVEQNAAIALRLASTAYVLDVGRSPCTGPPPNWPPPTRCAAAISAWSTRRPRPTPRRPPTTGAP